MDAAIQNRNRARGSLTSCGIVATGSRHLGSTQPKRQSKLPHWGRRKVHQKY